VAALDQCQIALAGSPNRTNALLGVARAAAVLDDAETAARHYATIVAQTSAGDPTREGLAEARAFVLDRR
jgi:hypothetical protein